MHSSLLSVAFVSAALLLALPAGPSGDAAAQQLQFPQASPPCTLQQRIGLTDVTVKFGRPGVKGRKIFGGLEPYGKVWRTGANSATTIQFSTDVKFGDADVRAGTYTLFSIPGEKAWTVILNEVAGQWGAYKYDGAKDVARVEVKPLALAAPIETFTFGFSDVRDASATFYFEWERVRVPVAIETDVVKTLVPQIEAVMAGSDEKKPYFQAAMFYFDNGLDLKLASAWIDRAVAEQPEAMWIVYRQGLIREKAGDKTGAAESARRALELAARAEGAIKDEYSRLSQSLLDRLR